VLQCVAVCCSVLQCVAVCCSVLQCVAVCCSVLQCVAVWCSVLQCVLQCVAVCCSGRGEAEETIDGRHNHLEGSRVDVRCCSVLQCVAVRCCVLQCVALRYSALHCVGAWYSILHRVVVCCSCHVWPFCCPHGNIKSLFLHLFFILFDYFWLI